MDYIDQVITSFGDYIYKIMPEGWIRNLIVDGIISGVGAIVIFLPLAVWLSSFVSQKAFNKIVIVMLIVIEARLLWRLLI